MSDLLERIRTSGRPPARRIRIGKNRGRFSPILTEIQAGGAFFGRFERTFLRFLPRSGEPKLLSSEYFVDELSKVIDPSSQEFWLLACVDYDPFGSIIARQFQQQLSFFGLKKSSMTSLITRDILTPQEQELYKYQLPINSKRMQTIAEKWLEETGGVNGELYGIESDVVPRDRIRARVAATIQSIPSSGARVR